MAASVPVCGGPSLVQVRGAVASLRKAMGHFLKNKTKLHTRNISLMMSGGSWTPWSSG